MASGVDGIGRRKRETVAGGASPGGGRGVVADIAGGSAERI